MPKPTEKPVKHDFEGIEIWTQYWYNTCRDDEKQMTIQIGDCFAQCRFISGRWTLPDLGSEVTREFKIAAQKFLDSYKEQTWYYVKEWSESARGGASMIHAEYLTQNPPHGPGVVSEKQDPDNEWSGFDCSQVNVATEMDLQDENLRVYS